MGLIKKPSELEVKPTLAAVLFCLGGIIATSEQEHLWQTLIGVAMIGAVAVLTRDRDDDPEKYPEEIR